MKENGLYITLLGMFACMLLSLELMPCIFCILWITEEVGHMKTSPIELRDERWGMLVGADAALISPLEGSDILCCITGRTVSVGLVIASRNIGSTHYSLLIWICRLR